MRTGRGSYRKSYIVPHGNGFKYLRRVPKDIQHIENKSAWVKCLGNVSRAEAETLAHALAHEHGTRILALRALSRQGSSMVGAIQTSENDFTSQTVLACPVETTAFTPDPHATLNGMNGLTAGSVDEPGSRAGHTLMELVELLVCSPKPMPG